MDSFEPLDASEIDKLRPRLRFRVAHELGFACADLDDVVQETLRRYLIAVQEARVRTPEAAGAFINGICRNVIFEYRRRMIRDVPMPEVPPEPPPKSISPPDLFEMRDAIADAMRQLSARDRQVLQLFYLEERPVSSILETAHLSEPNFRVVLCRARDRFRQIYLDACNKRGADVIRR
jgi:RNA polymerase sigma-70 factor (ECF subfamily)